MPAARVRRHRLIHLPEVTARRPARRRRTERATAGTARRQRGLYLSHTRVRGAHTLRTAIGRILTEHRHVEAAWAAIRQAADSVTEALTA